MSINQTEYHADPALSVLLKIAASSWRSCSFWARQKLKWVVVAFHSHRATGKIACSSKPIIEYIMEGPQTWMEWAWADRNATHTPGTAPAENSRMRHLGTSDQAELRTDIKSAAPAVANSATEVPSEVVDTNNNSFDSNKYQRVCDLRRQMLDNDPTVKFMLEKLDEVRSLGPCTRESLSHCLCDSPSHADTFLKQDVRRRAVTFQRTR